MTTELFVTLVVVGVVVCVLWFAWYGLPWLLRDDEQVPFDELMQQA